MGDLHDDVLCFIFIGIKIFFVTRYNSVRMNDSCPEKEYV